jgi:hypothetical protein
MVTSPTTTALSAKKQLFPKCGVNPLTVLTIAIDPQLCLKLPENRLTKPFL